MKYEIERIFLVKKDVWEKLKKPEGHFYRQGYISTEPEKTIRVRVADGKAFLTFKGISTGAKRLEYEYEIPVSDANEMLDEFTSVTIAKVRYVVEFGNKQWEVDVFEGDNEGLIVAELELEEEDEVFELPEWVGMEVTGDARYYNSSLVEKPFKSWG
ncbi:MAG: CYTH domain-containing protein [Ignavibacteria bacterium]